jgi:ABC-type transport system involved in cytochrome c biogenesis permease subunit
MAVKWNLLGLLLIVAMIAYVLAAAALVARARRLGTAFFATGFGVLVFAFGLRWWQVEHVPLQNMFEVVLTLGMLMFPITLFCRRFLGVRGEAFDAILGVIVLFPAAFVFKAEVLRLPPALQSFLFIPHVAAYMLSYVIMAKATVPAVLRLFVVRPSDDPAAVPYDEAAHRMVSLGFPLLTLGLVLGAVWGKLAWGDYWNWDPKELWSLVSWLVYLAYFHFRAVTGRKWPRVQSLLIVLGLIAIVLTLFWVNLARIFGSGMHSYAS